MRRKILLLLVLALAVGCHGERDGTNPAEWIRVLRHKRAAVLPSATPKQRQIYADTLASFVIQHPEHSRARQVYHQLQLDFANELASLGRYQNASVFYRSVLRAEPGNRMAIAGLRNAADHLAVSREKLLLLSRGMTTSEVAHILGRPLSGWTDRRERRGTTIESWYYKTKGGGVAGAYFRDGHLLAAEENSQARLSPLSWQ